MSPFETAGPALKAWAAVGAAVGLVACNLVTGADHIALGAAAAGGAQTGTGVNTGNSGATSTNTGEAGTGNIGASGGGSKTITVQDAIRHNAFIKPRPWRSRKYVKGFVDPFDQGRPKWREEDPPHEP